MSIEAFVSKFNAALDESIHRAMEGDVADGVKAAIASAVEEEVYKKYTPVEYQRRGVLGENGGLNDKNVMESHYDRTTMTLEVQDMSRDDETGRLIAPVVESGIGYQWTHSKIYKMQLARPFHKEAQRIAIQEDLVGEALRGQLEKDGFKPV